MGHVSYVHTVRLTNRGEQQNGQTHELIQNEDKIVLIVNSQAFFLLFLLFVSFVSLRAESLEEALY